MTDTPLPEPVAWLHPESNWANTDRYKVLIHCQNKGPFPVPLYKYADIAQQYAGALRMVMEAVGQLFGPIASIESEEAILLRGPEPHHDAEAIIASLQNVESALYAERQAREAAEKSAAHNRLHAEHEHNEGKRLSLMLKEAEVRLKEALAEAKQWQDAFTHNSSAAAWAIGTKIELEERLAEAEAVIAPFASFYQQAEGFVQARAEQGGSPKLSTKHFYLQDFRAAAAWIAKGETDVAS